MRISPFLLSSALLATFCLSTADAHAAKLRLKLTGGSHAGKDVVALRVSDGKQVARQTVASNGKVTLNFPASATVMLAVIDAENNFAGEIAATKCNGNLKKLCGSMASKSFVGFRAITSAMLEAKEDSSGFFKVTAKNASELLNINRGVRATAAAAKPIGTADNLGVTASELSAANNKNAVLDPDRDGVPLQYDADRDNDEVINNYDPTDSNPASVSAAAVTVKEVRVFSNLKLGIEGSLNANTGTTPSASQIDAALSSAGTLAIAVAGDADAGDETEMDCGALSYCSSGGTGTSNAQAFPDDFDADSDGLGSVEEGPTGDFQLSHGAGSAAIGAGDTFEQVVTDTDSKVTRVPGMLNFTFNTTPALKTLVVDGGSTFNVTYPATSGMAGSPGNCFAVPATGDVILTLTGWRPQKPSADGFVDIGGSLVTIDLPNPPCVASGLGGCSGAGPGNCAASTYSTSDTNLTVGANGLEDGFADTPADPANTLSFTVNITSCLGATAFNSGERLFIDLQMRSPVYGDNAAQKFCIERL